MLQIPAGDFRAYLFDCDGTIADTMPMHFRAWNETLAQWGCRYDTELFYAWAGVPAVKTVEQLNERFGLAMPPREVAEKKEALYMSLLTEVRPIPSVVEQIELRHGQIPLAVVSGSPRDSVLRTLDALGLREKFSAIVAAEDCARGKPHPDPFLRAAELVGVPPRHCLVFEDGVLGIRAAEAAGMAWVKV